MLSNIKNLQKYNKFIIALVGAVISGLLLYYGQNVPEWVNMVIYLATALGVYGIRNK